MFPQKALDVRIYACWCEQDQSLDLAKHLHRSPAGTHASSPLVSHFIGSVERCCLAQRRARSALLVEQNTESSAVPTGLTEVTYAEGPALTLPKKVLLESCAAFHAVLRYPERASVGVMSAQADTPTLPENEGGQFIHLCVLRVLFKCSVSPYADVGQIIVTAAV